jgi:hypothetical protein
MLAELEAGPTASSGASSDDLAMRKKMVEQLIIEESKHEALEEMYFWPAVREKLPGGDTLADTAIGQEQEGQEVLDKLHKTRGRRRRVREAGDQVHRRRPQAHHLRGDTGLAVAAECLVCRGG